MFVDPQKVQDMVDTKNRKEVLAKEINEVSKEASRASLDIRAPILLKRHALLIEYALLNGAKGWLC
jgi:hypothetical protein